MQPVAKCPSSTDAATKDATTDAPVDTTTNPLPPCQQATSGPTSMCSLPWPPSAYKPNVECSWCSHEDCETESCSAALSQMVEKERTHRQLEIAGLQLRVATLERRMANGMSWQVDSMQGRIESASSAACGRIDEVLRREAERAISDVQAELQVLYQKRENSSDPGDKNLSLNKRRSSAMAGVLELLGPLEAKLSLRLNAVEAQISNIKQPSSSSAVAHSKETNSEFERRLVSVAIADASTVFQTGLEWCRNEITRLAADTARGEGRLDRLEGRVEEAVCWAEIGRPKLAAEATEVEKHRPAAEDHALHGLPEHAARSDLGSTGVQRPGKEAHTAAEALGVGLRHDLDRLSVCCRETHADPGGTHAQVHDGVGSWCARACANLQSTISSVARDVEELRQHCDSTAVDARSTSESLRSDFKALRSLCGEACADTQELRGLCGSTAAEVQRCQEALRGDLEVLQILCSKAREEAQHSCTQLRRELGELRKLCSESGAAALPPAEAASGGSCSHNGGVVHGDDPETPMLVWRDLDEARQLYGKLCAEMPQGTDQHELHQLGSQLQQGEQEAAQKLRQEVQELVGLRGEAKSHLRALQAQTDRLRVRLDAECAQAAALAETAHRSIEGQMALQRSVEELWLSLGAERQARLEKHKALSDTVESSLQRLLLKVDRTCVDMAGKEPQVESILSEPLSSMCLGEHSAAALPQDGRVLPLDIQGCTSPPHGHSASSGVLPQLCGDAGTPLLQASRMPHSLGAGSAIIAVKKALQSQALAPLSTSPSMELKRHPSTSPSTAATDSSAPVRHAQAPRPPASQSVSPTLERRPMEAVGAGKVLPPGAAGWRECFLGDINVPPALAAGHEREYLLGEIRKLREWNVTLCEENAGMRLKMVDLPMSGKGESSCCTDQFLAHLMHQQGQESEPARHQPPPGACVGPSGNGCMAASGTIAGSGLPRAGRQGTPEPADGWPLIRLRRGTPGHSSTNSAAQSHSPGPHATMPSSALASQRPASPPRRQPLNLLRAPAQGASQQQAAQPRGPGAPASPLLPPQAGAFGGSAVGRDGGTVHRNSLYVLRAHR